MPANTAASLFYTQTCSSLLSVITLLAAAQGDLAEAIQSGLDAAVEAGGDDPALEPTLDATVIIADRSLRLACVAGSIFGGVVATGLRFRDREHFPVRAEIVRLVVNIGVGLLLTPLVCQWMVRPTVGLTLDTAFATAGLLTLSGWSIARLAQRVTPAAILRFISQDEKAQP